MVDGEEAIKRGKFSLFFLKLTFFISFFCVRSEILLIEIVLG